MTRCSHPQHPEHAPCVVCHDTYRTRVICEFCRDDPSVEGWHEPPREDHEDVDILGAVSPRHASLIERPIRKRTDTEQEILRLLTLGFRTVERRARRRIEGVRVWVTIEERRAQTFRSVAAIVKRSEAYVRRVYRNAVGH